MSSPNNTHTQSSRELGHPQVGRSSKLLPVSFSQRLASNFEVSSYASLQPLVCQQSPDLNLISDMITDRLGDEVASSARENSHKHVSPGVLRATSRQAPSSAHLDNYLENIAKSYGVSWIAGPRRQDLCVLTIADSFSLLTSVPVEPLHCQKCSTPPRLLRSTWPGCGTSALRVRLTPYY